MNCACTVTCILLFLRNEGKLFKLTVFNLNSSFVSIKFNIPLVRKKFKQRKVLRFLDFRGEWKLFYLESFIMPRREFFVPNQCLWNMIHFLLKPNHFSASCLPMISFLIKIIWDLQRTHMGLIADERRWKKLPLCQWKTIMAITNIGI